MTSAQPCTLVRVSYIVQLNPCRTVIRKRANAFATPNSIHAPVAVPRGCCGASFSNEEWNQRKIFYLAITCLPPPPSTVAWARNPSTNNANGIGFEREGCPFPIRGSVKPISPESGLVTITSPPYNFIVNQRKPAADDSECIFLCGAYITLVEIQSEILSANIGINFITLRTRKPAGSIADRLGRKTFSKNL